MLEDKLFELLPIGQVSFKSYLPSKKIHLSHTHTTGQDFFQDFSFFSVKWQFSSLHGKTIFFFLQIVVKKKKSFSDESSQLQTAGPSNRLKFDISYPPVEVRVFRIMHLSM